VREILKSGVYFSFSVSPKNQQELRYFFFSCVCAYLLNTHVAWIPCVGAKRFEKKKEEEKRYNPVH